jgi:hypothetical protein
MISVASKIAMTRASGIWLLVLGAAIMIYGLFSLGVFMVSWGFDDGNQSTDTLSLASAPAIIPGLLYLFAGWSLLLKRKLWLGYICLAVLSAASLWLAFRGISWYLAGAVILGSFTAAVMLVLSKRIFD